MNIPIWMHIFLLISVLSSVGPQVRNAMATTLLTQTQLATIW